MRCVDDIADIVRMLFKSRASAVQVGNTRIHSHVHVGRSQVSLSVSQVRGAERGGAAGAPVAQEPTQPRPSSMRRCGSRGRPDVSQSGGRYQISFGSSNLCGSQHCNAGRNDGGNEGNKNHNKNDYYHNVV